MHGRPSCQSAQRNNLLRTTVANINISHNLLRTTVANINVPHNLLRTTVANINVPHNLLRTTVANINIPNSKHMLKSVLKVTDQKYLHKAHKSVRRTVYSPEGFKFVLW